VVSGDQMLARGYGVRNTETQAGLGAATFHALLSQTSGLRDRSGDSGTDAEVALGDGARELTAADFVLPSGTVFSYSNLGFSLVGAALEGLRKRPCADVMCD
jgi:CubicO group peptidase (beta-lactamase class C family)